MVELLGVGRATLREALRLLETRGVLTIRSGSSGGPVVRRPRVDDLSRSLSLTLQFAEASLGDVMSARILLESAIVRAAAIRITAQSIAELRRINHELATAIDHEARFAAANQAFHDAIADACGSVALRIFVAALSSIGDGRAAGVYYHRSLRVLVAAEHADIIGALEQHDPDAAESAMRAHLDTTLAYWQQDFREVVARPIRWAIEPGGATA
jgi:DNA-binding FadR family transcriptional regulator